MPKLSNSDAARAIARRDDFETHTGNLSGRAHTPGRYVYTGQLPRGYAETVSAADYIVFSYATPIAWHLPDGWVIPPVSYSVTTSRHQGVAKYGARGDYSASHKRAGWELGLSPTASKILDAIRAGYAVPTGNRRRSTLQAVVDTGEAKWEDDTCANIVPADDSHIYRPRRESTLVR